MLSIRQVSGHTFDASVITSSSTVVDLGAHRGGFAQAIVELAGCKCIAVEANPVLCARLAGSDHLEALNYAISGSSGTVTLRLNNNLEGSTILHCTRAGESGQVQVPAITIPDLFNLVNVEFIDLVKVDIEGAEIAMFDSCPDALLQRVGQFTVEFHDFNGLVERSEVERIVKRMRDLGFACFKMWRQAYGDTLFINTARNPASELELLWLKYVTRHVKRCAHLLQRIAASA